MYVIWAVLGIIAGGIFTAALYEFKIPVIVWTKWKVLAALAVFFHIASLAMFMVEPDCPKVGDISGGQALVFCWGLGFMFLSAWMVIWAITEAMEEF